MKKRQLAISDLAPKCLFFENGLFYLNFQNRREASFSIRNMIKLCDLEYDSITENKLYLLISDSDVPSKEKTFPEEGYFDKETIAFKALSAKDFMRLYEISKSH